MGYSLTCPIVVRGNYGCGDKTQCHSDQVLFNGHNRGKRQTDGSAPDEIGLGVFQWWNIDSGLFTILVQTCQMDVLPKKWF